MATDKRFFVTREGIAASLVDARLHQDIKEALNGSAHTLKVQRLVRDGFVANDRRVPVKVDHNGLATSGVLDEVRNVVAHLREHVASPASPPSPTAFERSNGNRQQHWGRTPVGYVALPPKPRVIDSLPPSARSVYESLNTTPQSANELAKRLRASLNPGTVKWALQALRRSGLAQSKPLAV